MNPDKFIMPANAGQIPSIQNILEETSTVLQKNIEVANVVKRFINGIAPANEAEEFPEPHCLNDHVRQILKQQKILCDILGNIADGLGA